MYSRKILVYFPLKHIHYILSKHDILFPKEKEKTTSPLPTRKKAKANKNKKTRQNPKRLCYYFFFEN
jgi:hypothetical protein